MEDIKKTQIKFLEMRTKMCKIQNILGEIHIDMIMQNKRLVNLKIQ